MQGDFASTLTDLGLSLTRRSAGVLQVNVGLVCNMCCRHCHLEAGPQRDECMSRSVMDQTAELAAALKPHTVDITGGAPELNPDLPYLIERLAPLAPTLLLRSNLTAIAQGEFEELLDLCVRKKVTIVASLPAVNASQTEALRGKGVFDTSLAVLRDLNRRGYGRPGSHLELHLVSNPSGAFLPPDQAQTEIRFKRDLARRAGVEFNNLFVFANMPLGRFRTWLVDSGNYESYMGKLVQGFNPCTVENLMCRDLVSVNWDGMLFDCDFNLALGLGLGGRSTHISEALDNLAQDAPIAVGDHCFACTAGSGFT